MVLLVQKYGGSSLTDLSKLETVARKVKKQVESGYQIVLVLSALQGETDRLIGLVNLLTPDCPKREYDALLATGEQASACLMVMALSRLGVSAQTLNAWQAGIYGDGVHCRAAIEHIDTASIRSCLDRGIIPVITGFQAVSEDLSVATLGRGGSDTTALALAAALDADECQVYVDVQGIFTADPKVESSARLIHRIPIEQMMTYSNLGAKVMQKRAVACAAKYQVPLRICPTFIEGPGTVMKYDKHHAIEKTMVSAVAHANHQIVLQLSGLRILHSDVTDLYNMIGTHGCDIEHSLRQSHDDYYLDCLLSGDDYDMLSKQFERWLALRSHVQMRVTKNLARVSVIGFSMVKDIAMTKEVILCCRGANIQVRHLFAADSHVSVVIDQAYVELAVRSLHKHFSLGQKSVALSMEQMDAAT
ncbi:MAG TPA: aspartate kinase [Proteobacteria bacterium]|nr:aspartate kinase [Pseudomonadota bacterium]